MILKEVCNIYLGHGLLKNCNWKFKIFEAEGQNNIPLQTIVPFLLFKKI